MIEKIRVGTTVSTGNIPSIPNRPNTTLFTPFGSFFSSLSIIQPLQKIIIIPVTCLAIVCLAKGSRKVGRPPLTARCPLFANCL